MRFITEFELKHPYIPTRGYNSKKEMQDEMGKMIGDSFGWKEKALSAFTRYTLEIEAFPMDKWIEFKNKLFTELENPEPNGIVILQMIKDLEFYSNNKKAVDELTNPK